MLSLYTICLSFCFLWRKCFSDAWNSRGTLYMYIHMHVFVFFVFFQWSKFFSDPWSLFDLLVVAVSLISLVYICVLHLFVFSLYCVFSLYMYSLYICVLSIFEFALYMCPLYIECVLSVCHFLDFLVVAVSLISLVYRMCSPNICVLSVVVLCLHMCSLYVCVLSLYMSFLYRFL